MSNIHDIFKDEEVGGTIIGEVTGQCWVTYDGRKQGPMKFPDNYPEALCLCEEIKQNIRDEFPTQEVFDVIYPKDSWMFHFDCI